MSRCIDYVRCELVTGTVLYFPKEHVKKVMRKNKLVTEALDLQDQGRNAEASVVIGKIVRLNRSIPPCGITEEQYIGLDNSNRYATLIS